MLKKRLFIIFILSINSPNFIFCSSNQDTCKITYIANTGFLIEINNQKILIDALFGNIEGNWCEVPGDTISNLIIHGEGSFNDIDFLLITHYHVDHFNISMVSKFLEFNDKTKVICPEQVRELLLEEQTDEKIKERIYSPEFILDKDSLFTFQEIKILTLPTRHGSYFEIDEITGEKYDKHKNVQNLCFLIDINGLQIFHSGDAGVSIKSKPDLFKDRVDIALIDRVFLSREGQKIISDILKPKNTIYMHIRPDKYEYYKSALIDYSNVHIFSRKMEKKAFF